MFRSLGVDMLNNEHRVLPGGLVIGEIVEVGVDAYDRSPYAYVRLYADYTYAGTLLIVTGEEVAVDES